MRRSCCGSAGFHGKRCLGVAVSATAVAALLAGCAAGGGPTILSGYKSNYAAARTRSGPHPAIDYGGAIGDPILAAADGRVVFAANTPQCGNGAWIEHTGFGRYTLYCHMQELRIAAGDTVRRGQIIGLLGATGEPTTRTPPGGTAIPQLHFEFSDSVRGRQDGDLDGTFDPLSVMAGCFEPQKTYPTDKLVLTHPVRCRNPA